MAEKKITKVEMFKAIIEEVKGNADMVAFCEHEIELIERKTAKVTKKDKEKKAVDEAIANVILSTMAVERTVTEFIKGTPELAEFSTQKLVPILTALVKEGKVVKEIKKGKSLYTVIA